MKKQLWIALFLACLNIPLAAQQVYTNYEDGVVTFKINESSEVVLPDYNQSDTGTYPIMDSLVSKFGITKIYRPMRYSSKFPLRRVYRVNFDSITAVDSLIDNLTQYSFIEFEEKQPLYHYFTASAPNDPKLVWQWAFKRILADSLWSLLDSAGKEIKIAVIDDAFLTTHEDLQDVLLPGWDVADNDANVNPPPSATEIYFAHGTCAASVAGALTNNTKGIASLNLNNRIKIIPIKISPNASLGIQDIDKAIDIADSLGADIISISLGGAFFRKQSMMQ